MQHSDVLIIGAGPAGCAAAIQCAQSGLTVTLIDGAALPRDRPGETLHPGVEPLLDRLGLRQAVLEANFLRHEGIWVERDGARQFEAYGSGPEGTWRGFQACGADFDNILLRRAAQLGVQIRESCTAVELLCDRSRIAGAMTSAGPLFSRFTLDASGPRSWLARQLRLDRRRVGPRRLVQYGYMQGRCPIRDEAPSFVHTSHGWIWTARVRPNIYQWTRLLAPSERFLRTWAPEEFRTLSPLGPPKACDMTWRIIDDSAGPGYFLLGDSAVMLDPSSSHGVLRALMSGMLAGFFVANAIRGSLREDIAGNAYRQWLKQWFNHDCERLGTTSYDEIIKNIAYQFPLP